MRADLAQAGHDGVRIPAGREPLATLAGAAQRRTGGQYAAAAGAVEHQRAEPAFQRLVRLRVRQCFHGLSRGLEPADQLAQVRVVVQSSAPEGRHVGIKLDQQTAIDQSFHHGGERDDGAASEGFDQQPRLRVQTAKPGADVRDQPGLAARIAQRAALRNRRDIGGGDRGVRKVGRGHWS